MATNLANTILAALLAQMATTLGASWKKLKDIHDLDNLSGRAGFGAQSYGVIVGSRVENPNTPLGTICWDHTFNLVLVDLIERGDTSYSAQTAITDLEDKLSDIYKALAPTNLGLSGVVLVSDSSAEEPSTIRASKFVSVQKSIVVRYRINT